MNNEVQPAVFSLLGIDILDPGFDNDGTAGDGQVTWQHLLDFVEGINDGTYQLCNAGKTDWRLPNARELESLIHYGYDNPALPNTAGTGQWTLGDPFINLWADGFYWSFTVNAYNTDGAWYVSMYAGNVNVGLRGQTFYVWCVRGGH